MLRVRSPISQKIFFCCILFCISATFARAQSENIGFVEGLWYAKEPIFADTKTRIYVAFRNNAESDLTATIRFTDNEKRIGSSEVHALSGRLVEAWVDWTPTYGEHTLTATLENATLHAVGLPPQKINTEGFTVSDTRTVDHDTDSDGIGNTDDQDDDNDSVSDEAERVQGTDPLIKNQQPEQKTENKESKENSPIEDTAGNTTGSQKPLAELSHDTEEGLEQYVGEGVVGKMLGNVTEKVQSTKQSLDDHRSERNALLYTKKSESTESTATNTEPDTNTATITRTKIDTNHSFIKSFIDGLRSILQNIWTLILFIFSTALTHPALIQILLLVGILYIFYRLMRSVGRRPNT